MHPDGPFFSPQAFGIFPPARPFGLTSAPDPNTPGRPRHDLPGTPFSCSLLPAGEDATVALEEFVLSQLTVPEDKAACKRGESGPRPAAVNFPRVLSELTVLSAPHRRYDDLTILGWGER